MIIDRIENARLYLGLGTAFKEAFSFLQAKGFENKEPGRCEISGGTYCLVQRYETRPEAGCLFEAHRRYIDLHYIVAGTECHRYSHLAGLELREPYSESSDAAMYGGQGSRFTLGPGFFAIYYPEDAHMPNLIAAETPEKMIKVVVKIPAA
jgi:YhcH/YjgK/YiaL family protein